MIPYPCLDEHFDLRRKISSIQTKELIVLFKRGFSITRLSKRFHLSVQRVLQITHPESYRESKEKTKLWIKKRMKDPEYRRRILKRGSESKKRRYRLIPKMKRYFIEHQKQSSKKNG